jgi:hypothetical protein
MGRSDAGEPIRVPLTNGGYALVDEEDWPKVDEHKWFRWTCKKNGVTYAVRSTFYKGKRGRVLMHRQIFGLEPGDKREVDHINHDGLDNRRSSNLRLATRSQNMANCRKMAPSASRFRGVKFDKRSGKWIAKIGITIPGGRKHIHLGSYGTEGEAAFAFHVVAPLIRDPAFLCLPEIPEETLPDISRREEIRIFVIERVKFSLSGNSGRIDRFSKFNGVTYRKSERRWTASITIGSRHIALGSFHSEAEAAFAYNCAVKASGLKIGTYNCIPEDATPNPDIAGTIKARVRAKIDSFRERGWKTDRIKRPNFRLPDADVLKVATEIHASGRVVTLPLLAAALDISISAAARVRVRIHEAGKWPFPITVSPRRASRLISHV